MVFAFTNEHLRNIVGRALREAGYECIGSQTSGEHPCLLTVHEGHGGRRDAVEQMTRQLAPTATRLR